jgi:tetratricopeptide (TPR) repeat protein
MIDRDDARRRAQALARHNQVEAAIGEYVRLLAANPGDQASANELGDLYVRAGRADLAAERYIEVARALHREGFFSRATGFYRKILKLQPGHAQVLLALGQALQSQRLLVEARKAFDDARHALLAVGDAPGAAAVAAHLAALDRATGPPRAAAPVPPPAPADPRRDLLRAVADLAERTPPDEAVEDRAPSPPPVPPEERAPSAPPTLPEERAPSPPASDDGPEVQLSLARAFLDALLPDEAEALLVPITADPAHRVRAAAMLAEALDAQDRPVEAVEWLERVAQAPEVTDADRAEAMGRLAALLERVGEPERALAVWLELAAARPEDANAAAAVDRLMREAGRGGDPSTP